MKKNELTTAISGELIRASGGKQGGKQRTPVETPDSLRSIAYARILDMVSEGEIYGFPNVANPLANVFFNETPVANDDGSLNFKNVSMDWRPGTQTQDHHVGFDTVESEIAVGVELRSDTPWTHALTNLDLDAVRIRISVPSLSKADTSTGDIQGYTINYRIEVSTDGGSYVTRLTSAFSGKTTTKYERSHRIDLLPATTGWQIRVVRETANASTGTIADTTIIESYAELVDAKLRMPMTASVAIIVDAEQFNSIPARAYRLKGRIIKVPSNYNAETREYDGVWDGTFQLAYTNNPAWCFYDLAINERYGLGKRVTADLMDKWALYKIARYCDELVDDGKGGQEPRFTCNLYLQSREDATRVMQNMSTIFRGIMYASGSTITAVGDMPDDPIYTYTPANVIDGKFVYQGTSIKARHTVALVSWNDLSDFGRAKVEYIADEDGIARYGVQPTEVLAMGCTSQGQARRLGKYILATERYETDSVSFTVGIDGTFPVPGRVILIADPLRAGRRNGGRISAATLNSITVDKIPVVDPGNRVTVILPTGAPQERIVLSVVGNIITVTEDFDAIPVAQSVWIVESDDVNAQRFRVVSVLETKPGSLEYAVTAIQHVEGKYAFVEQDIAIEEPSITTGINKIVGTPTDVAITWYDIADDNTTAQVVNATWNPVADAVMYELQWRVNDADWHNIGATPGANREFYSPTNGDFYLQITAINGHGVRSSPAYAGPFTVSPNAKPPGFVGDLEVAIAEALETAENAQATADGAIVSYWQTSPPTIGAGAGEAKEGDIWFDTNDGNKIYRVVSGAWVLAADDDMAQALAAASTAQATADGKVKTYFQSTAPVNSPVGTLVLGDLWFDTTPGVGKLYRWSGTSWSQNIGDVTADQLAGNGTNLIWDEYSRYLGPSLPATTVEGTGTRVFDATDRAVGSTTSGSLKFTTSSGGVTDKLWFGNSVGDYNIPISPNGKYIISMYVKVGTAGQVIQLRAKDSFGNPYTSGDITVASTGAWIRQSFVADLSASGATALLVGIDPNRSAVSGRNVWIDGVMVEPQIGTKTTPSTWVPGAAGRNALVAIANAATAQATADGKIDSWYQTSPPTIGTSAGQAREGDIWFDTDDGNKIYTVVSGAWVATPDSRIAVAIAAAGTAQSTADGKSTLFYAVAASPPTATGVGDLWFQTDTKLMKRWSGSAWVDNGGTLVSGQIQNGVILPYSFGDELVANGNFESNVSGTRATTTAIRAVGENLCDGWQVRYNASGGLSTAIGTYLPDAGTYDLFIGVAVSTSVPAGAELRTDVKMIQSVPVKGGDRFLFSAYMTWYSNMSPPAGLSPYGGAYVVFYNAAGSTLATEILSAVYNSTTRLSKAITAPASSAYAEIFVLAGLYNSSGAPVMTGVSPIQLFFDSISLKRLSITGSNPNLLVNADFTDGNNSWAGAPTIYKSTDEAYQARSGALASGVNVYYYQTVSLAVSAGDNCTFSAEVFMVGTLDSSAKIQLTIEYFDIAGTTLLGTTPAALVTAATQGSNYTRLVTSGPAPSGVGYVRPVVTMRGAISAVGIFRRPKLERGPIDTAYQVGIETVVGQELVIGNSGRRIGDARNMRQAQSAGVGAIASNGIITATSAGVVSIAAFTMSYGGSVTISYSAVASAISGLTVGTTYYIYCLDDTYAGGARTWLATTSLATAMNAGLGVVVAGQVKIPAAGSTSPPDPSDPACPVASMVTPEGRHVASYVANDWMPCWDLNVENPGMTMRQVRNNKLVLAHCACLHAENGIEVEQSLTTPMQLPDGTYRKTVAMFGQPMLTWRNGEPEWSQVTDIRDLGMKLVAKVDLDDSILLAGRTIEEQVATHNIKWKP